MQPTNIKDLDEYCRLTDRCINITHAHSPLYKNTPTIKGYSRGYATKHKKV